MVSISGIRGVVGESLTPEVIVKYSAAFAEYCKRRRIVIGRDGRITGKIIGNIVSSTLLSMGCDVIALGVVPTPTVQLAVEHLGAAGGVSITASHNPIEWNGSKFIGSTGMFLNKRENLKLWSIADSRSPKYATWENIGKHSADESWIDRHIEKVIQLPYVTPDRIKRKHFRIVVDSINAAGGIVVPKLLRTLGCDVIEMNCDLSGVFVRKPEPIPENLTQLCSAVLKEKADFGIAVDPDVDRLALITEKGEPFGEEYTITSAVKFVLGHPQQKSKSPRKVVVNLSTTRAVDDVAHESGATVVRTPVGEINVASKMKEIGAIIGGEGSGGVILPAVHYGRDAIVGIGLILQQLTEFGGTLSQFKATLPQYVIVKDKIGIGKRDAETVLKNIRKNKPNGGKVNAEDGLKISFRDSWVHLRKSNTEPIIRIIAEAPTHKEAAQLVQSFKARILKAGN